MGYSRFYLCDLQVHTPADNNHRYGDVGGSEPNARFAETLVAAHRDAGVEVVVVTDHNRVGWYPALRKAGDAAGVYVFPGLEFSVHGCHLIAIWDRIDDGYELAKRFLGGLWRPSEKRFKANGEARPVTRAGVLELADDAAQHGALIVAPHATAKGMGVFASKVCPNSSEVAQSGLVVGFDVCGNTGADVLVNPRSEFGDVPPRWFISGDVRSLDDVGSRAVYLKLGETPTLEGLRQAFLMPGTRIRFPEKLSSQWGKVKGLNFIDDPKPSWPRLGSIDVVGGFHDGLRVQFGPGLNAVIGGKGTGKSTLVEIIRYVLEAGEPIEVDSKGNRRHNFGANAEARIGFVDEQGDLYDVRRSGDETSGVLMRGGVDTEVAVGRRVSVSVFGQRELRALVERPGMLRLFVASRGGAEWQTAEAKDKELKDALRSHDLELVSLETDLARMDEAEGDLADVRDKLKLAEEKGVTDLLKASKELSQFDRGVRKVLGWPGDVRAAVASLEETLPAPSLPDYPGVPTSISEAVNTLETLLKKDIAEMEKTVAATEAVLAVAETAWACVYRQERSSIDAQLSDAGISEPKELERLQRRASELDEQIRQLPEKRRRHGELEQERRGVLQKLAGLRRNKSRMVEEAARHLSAAVGPRVRVTVRPLADKAELMEVLEQAVRGQQVRREQLQRVARSAPLTLGEAIREGASALEALGCTSGTASKLAALPPSSIRDIEESDTPDEIQVEIDLGPPGAEAWEDVKEVSPGQRATALLALALASGNEPLIIDQPEDDLDNRYIYEEVVRVLAEVCQSRQVIVATHNANIPVLGDAEMILALDAQANRSSVLAYGGLEDPDVATCARQILEGGDQAFEARHRRYLAARRERK